MNLGIHWWNPWSTGDRLLVTISMFAGSRWSSLIFLLSSLICLDLDYTSNSFILLQINRKLGGKKSSEKLIQKDNLQHLISNETQTHRCCLKNTQSFLTHLRTLYLHGSPNKILTTLHPNIVLLDSVEDSTTIAVLICKFRKLINQFSLWINAV